MSDEKKDLEKVKPDETKPAIDVKAFSEEMEGMKKRLADAEAKATALEADNANQRKEALDAREEGRFSEVLSKARRDKKLTGKTETALAVVFGQLPYDDASEAIEFGEGTERKSLKPREILIDAIRGLPELAIFSEAVSTGESVDAGQVDATDYENAGVAKRANDIFNESGGAKSRFDCVIQASKELKSKG